MRIETDSRAATAIRIQPPTNIIAGAPDNTDETVDNKAPNRTIPTPTNRHSGHSIFVPPYFDSYSSFFWQCGQMQWMVISRWCFGPSGFCGLFGNGLSLILRQFGRPGQTTFARAQSAQCDGGGVFWSPDGLTCCLFNNASGQRIYFLMLANTRLACAGRHGPKLQQHPNN